MLIKAFFWKRVSATPGLTFAANDSHCHSDASTKPPILPWYVAGFLIAGLAVTLAGYLPGAVHGYLNAVTNQLVQAANLLIGTSMAAIGLQVDFRLLGKYGPKLMLTAGVAWLLLFGAIFGLCLIWK